MVIRFLPIIFLTKNDEVKQWSIRCIGLMGMNLCTTRKIGGLHRTNTFIEMIECPNVSRTPSDPWGMNECMIVLSLAMGLLANYGTIKTRGTAMIGDKRTLNVEADTATTRDMAVEHIVEIALIE